MELHLPVYHRGATRPASKEQLMQRVVNENLYIIEKKKVSYNIVCRTAPATTDLGSGNTMWHFLFMINLSL